MGVGITQATPSSAATSCAAVRWGSLTKATSPMTAHPLTGVRSGQHPCFDRLVLDLAPVGSGYAGYNVSYVSSVRTPGSGRSVSVRGGAVLKVTANAPMYDAAGRATYRPTNSRALTNVAGYRTFRQVALAGSYEGRTTIALGVRARLPMRAFVLTSGDGGQRLVIDVQHRW
ncbi:hypothetical protein FGL98_17945 [Leekyejoonella antrihumi]|uniref:AMIN-like domain-containing protein n=1 Tax=Leekyejoonella antrihumi TaxID=1660198 RepID=A0A563DVX3_9MICO|nr:hypothetical protein FGL98_17945 [Leekyejoonella antrihumi]